MLWRRHGGFEGGGCQVVVCGHKREPDWSNDTAG